MMMVGTLLANGVLSSCYANVKSHDDAHFWMGLIRAYDQMARVFSVQYPFGAEQMDEVHIIPRLMHWFAAAVYPSALSA